MPSIVSPAALSPDFCEALRRQPWRFGFLPVMRRIAARTPPGRDRPDQEILRLGQQPSLAFAPREIASVMEEEGGRLKMRLFGLGMLGSQGALPLHITEIARSREEVEHDRTLVDFLDLFHHRYLTLFYRAWASAQATAGLDHPADERFSRFVASLVGFPPHPPSAHVVPSHARLAASPHLLGPSRCPDGVCATLAHYFSLPVRMREAVLQWMPLSLADQGRLGRSGSNATLGEGAVLGSRVADRQYRCRLILGPMDFTTYLRFLPGGDALPALRAWMRTFVGATLIWELELQIKAGQAPSACLGGAGRMGWSTWLRPGDGVVTLCFDPARYPDATAGRPMPPSPGARCAA